MAFLLVWGICAVVVWIALMAFTDFVLWDDEPIAIVIGMIVAAFMCAAFWPFVLMAGIGTWLRRG